MNTNKYFKKYYSKLRAEAILKSVLCGLAVGFGANFVAALATWFAPFEGLWISVGVLFAVTLIASPIFYFARFRLSDIKNARRLDRLGLEERLITMVEFDDDTSYVAQAQREDAKRALETIEKSQIKFKISKGIVAAVACLAILGTGMTTVSALSDYGFMPGGDEIVDSIIEEPQEEIASEVPVASPVENVKPTNSATAKIQDDIKSVLVYMDQLLENLPEDKIEEFAKSEHFDTYKKLFNELGISN
jgi:hypothetical protein